MSKNQTPEQRFRNKKIKKQYKMDVKRMAIYFVCLIPVLVVVSTLLHFYTNFNSSIIITLIVVIGIVIAGLCEVVYYIVKSKKDAVAETKPKSDPYA